MNQFEKMKLGGASASSLKGSASANVAVFPGRVSESAVSLAFKALFFVFTLATVLVLSVGSAYASSGSNSDNDADVSDDATMIYKSSFEDGKSYTITEGGTYKLAEDIENGQIEVNGNIKRDKIVLDLNGHTLTNKTKGKQALYVVSEIIDDDFGTWVNLEVTDSGNEGAIVADSASENTAIRIDSKSYTPEVTLNGIKVTSYASECIASLQGQLTINDATLQTAQDKEAALIYANRTGWEESTVTINSGSFSTSAISVFKLDSSDYGSPSVTLNGGTYNKAPIGGYLDEGKSAWKTDAGYVVGNTSEKPSDYIYKAVLPGSGVLWFSSTDDAEKFAEDYTGSTGTAVHKISFTNKDGEPEVNTPAQYVVDGCHAIKPDKDPASDDYKFNGWKNGTETYNFEDEVTSDLSLTADWSLYVAQVGDAKFTSVEDAITNSSSNDTVKLIQNIEGQIDVTHTHKVTLDLNGHTVKNNNDGAAVVIDGSSSNADTLTITDSAADGKKGAIIQEATNAGAIRLDGGSPFLNLDGITIETVSSECLQVNNGTVELNNVVMSTQNKANSLIYTKSSNGVEINSGTYTAADGAALITEVDGGAGTKINGGSFNIFPANGTLSEGKVLLKAADSDEAKGCFKVVDSDDASLDTAKAVVGYSGATIYFADASEAAAFIENHEEAVLKTLVSAKITEPENLVYDGTAKEATVVLTGIAEADEGKVSAVLEYEYPDGTKTSEAPVNAGNYTVTVTGLEGDQVSKYELKNSESRSFTVEKAEANIRVANPGTKTVGDASFKLNATADTNATLEYASSNKSVAEVDETGQVTVKAAGTAILTVSADEVSNYKQSEALVELIVNAPTPAVADISKAKVTLSKTAFTYNGKAQKPSVKSVVLNGKTLKSGTDYTASIASGKKVGTYKVTINAKGSYTGQATASFVVNPKGVSKFKVSKAKKAFKAKWTKNKTERSGVQIRYSTKKSMAGAKTVKAKGASVKAKTVKKLKKKTKYYVQARSYKVVNGKTYYSSWSAKKAVKTK